jgi:hypothetical protein
MPGIRVEGVPDPLRLGNGSAAAPTYSFASDPDTGVFRVGANDLALVVAGAINFEILNTGAAAFGGVAPVPGYNSAGDITLAANRNIRANNTAKAWVQFEATGALSMRDSFNVTSVTDNGLGDFTVNFTNAIGNATYAWSGSVKDTAAERLNLQQPGGGTKTTTALQVVCLTAATNFDSDDISVVIFGD